MDDASFEFDCPEWGRSVKTTVRAGRRGRSVRCPSGHSISVDGSNVDRQTRKVEKDLNKLMRRFK